LEDIKNFLQAHGVVVLLFVSLGEKAKEAEKPADQQRDQQADGCRDTIDDEGGFDCVCHVVCMYLYVLMSGLWLACGWFAKDGGDVFRRSAAA
jgi:hypothetical protein